MKRAMFAALCSFVLFGCESKEAREDRITVECEGLISEQDSSASFKGLRTITDADTGPTKDTILIERDYDRRQAADGDGQSFNTQHRRYACEWSKGLGKVTSLYSRAADNAEGGSFSNGTPTTFLTREKWEAVKAARAAAVVPPSTTVR